MFTREELIAEANRRGLKIPERTEPTSNLGNGINREELVAEARRRGLSIPGEFNENPFMSAARGFNNAFERSTHGALQPLLESGYLGDRVRQGSQNVAREREEGARLAQQLNPNATMAGGIGGNVAMALPGIVAGGGAGNLLKAMLGGALSSGLSGGAEYVNPGESRLENAILSGIGGGILGALPGAGKFAGKQIKKGFNIAKNLPEAANAEKLAARVLKDKAAINDVYKKGYTNLFKEAEEAGIGNVKVPKIRAKSILKNTTRTESEALSDFLKNPTMKNAHSAQSDLGKVIRRLEKINQTTGLKTPQIRALESAKDAQKRIRGSMHQSFQNAKQPELARKYGELTEGYKNEVIPYRNKIISDFSKGESTAADFLRSAAKNKKFKAQLGEKYPAIELRQQVPDIIKLLGAGTVGAGGYKYFFD